MQRKRAFTLIELLIVVAIIGVLAAIAVPNFLQAQMRAKLAQVTSNFKALSTAIMAYKADNNCFPLHDGPYHYYNCPGVTTPVSYISRVPVDIFQSATITDPAQRLSAWNQPKRNPELHPEPFYTNSTGAYGVASLDKEIPPAGSANDLTLRFIDNGPLFKKARSTYPEGRYMVSIGPDLVHSVPGVYDVSNGLTSAGDIIWVVP
jgi:prepilin-type N-terminal cleavage/methylation domain-containing protein